MRSPGRNRDLVLEQWEYTGVTQTKDEELRPREIMTCSRSYLKVGLEPGYAPGATNEIPSLFICLTDQRNLGFF